MNTKQYWKHNLYRLRNRSILTWFRFYSSLIWFLAFISVLVFTNTFASENKDLWRNIKEPNHFVIMRHALAPGTGDPQNFKIEDCSTQRNLSDEGREQAKAIGKRLREHGIDSIKVYSSQWCRCLETAKLLGIGDVEESPLLNSFFRNFEQRKVQTKKLREWLLEQTLDQPLLLVTHQVNITALTNIYPKSGGNSNSSSIEEW